MPESVKDRCTKAHEYIFLLSKGPRYYFDAEAIKEPAIQAGRVRADSFAGRQGTAEYQVASGGVGSVFTGAQTRNRRSVWTVTTKPFKGAHFATFPPDLILPCILAGCPKDGLVIDPFNGAGTVGVAAMKHSRKYLGIELNPDYCKITLDRWGVVNA